MITWIIHLLEKTRDRLVEGVVRKEGIFRVCVNVWRRDEEFTVRHKDVLDPLSRIQDHRSFQRLI